MNKKHIVREDNTVDKKSVESLMTIIKSITIDKWILIGLAGLVLILCSDSCGGVNKDMKPQTSNSTEYSDNDGDYASDYETDTYKTTTVAYVDNLEKQLCEILSTVDGVGKVNVMITLKNTVTKNVLMEEPYTENIIDETDNEGGERNNSEKSWDYRVIFKENSDGESVPFVISESAPDIAGVAIVAEGGDSPVVKDKITNIIKALFGIEINKIAVGKMK